MKLNNELEEIIKHFALELDSCITRIQQVKDTIFPEKVYDVYRIHTKENKEYILKFDSRGYEYMVYKCIFDTKRLPVPSCLKKKEIDNRTWILISDVGNQNLVTANLDKYLTAARSLAIIHSKLAEEDLKEYGFLKNKTNKIAMNLAYLKDNNNLPCEIADSIYKAGERLLKRPFTMIHDDLLPINIMDGNAEVFFIDWANASYGCSAHDLGRLLGDIRDEKERYWVNPTWKQAILKSYYDALQIKEKIEWKDFVLDFDCACIWNYAEIIIAHLRNDWEHSAWYHANVRAITEYKSTD